MAVDWKSAYAEMHAAGEAAFPPAALLDVLQLCRRLFQERGGQGVAPADIVAAFRAQTRRDFGPLLGAVLEDWRLQSPEALGRAVLLLAKYHCLTLSPTDTLAAFAAHPEPFHAP